MHPPLPACLPAHLPVHEPRPLHDEAVGQVVEEAAREGEGADAAEGLDEDDLDALGAEEEAEGVPCEADGEAGACVGGWVVGRD